MIQSHHVLDDWGHQIYYGQMSRDDTIPLQHHYSPFRGRTLLKEEASSVHHHPNHHHLHLQYLNTNLSPSVSPVCEYRKHHHLYIQYRNTKSPSSVSTVCKYWNIIYIFSMGILKSSSSISSVWEYWNIIISIFSIEILNHHHLHLILYVEIPCRNTRFLRVTSEHRVLCHHN